ncbi:hypothetical protein F2P81_022397 [Scophthalmus maximus]|uniref:Uncharacterized protein n=1 Tax=Scophthalmus maximus TaxID=52904 RepID=A0A6A4RS84_SCOMX|nr:hypothetical protein F2P81_022397 [Scophthalmus maximus]
MAGPILQALLYINERQSVIFDLGQGNNSGTKTVALGEAHKFDSNLIKLACRHDCKHRNTLMTTDYNTDSYNLIVENWFPLKC